MLKSLKIISINVILLFIVNLSFAEITYVEVNAKGKSDSYELALKKALKEVNNA